MDVSALLDEIGSSPTEIGRRLGVSDGHIHDLKSGRRKLSIKLAAKLEQVTKRKGVVAAVVARKMGA